MLAAVLEATRGASAELKVPAKEDLELPQNYMMRVLKANGL